MSEFDILLLCISYNSFSRSLHWTIQILLLWSLVFCAILIRKQCVTINFCHHFWVYFPTVHLFNIKRLIPISKLCVSVFNNYHFLNDYLPERSEMLFAAHSQFSFKRLLLTNIIMWIINFLNTTKGPHSANSFEAARSRVWPCLPCETEKHGPLSAHSLGTTSSRMWHCLPCRTDKLDGGGRVSSPFLPWLSLGLVGEQETGR